MVRGWSIETNLHGRMLPQFSWEVFLLIINKDRGSIPLEVGKGDFSNLGPICTLHRERVESKSSQGEWWDGPLHVAHYFRGHHIQQDGVLVCNGKEFTLPGDLYE